jgi:hypothetical protein
MEAEMFSMIPFRLSRPMAALILAVSPVTVAAQVAEPSSFRDIEYAMVGPDIVAAEQALAMRLAPRGVTIMDASAALRAAGARRLRSAADGDLRFVFATGDFANDMPRDIRIIIRVSPEGDRVGSVMVKREAYGG